jgi:FAD:protein FMN transferase
MHWNNIFSHRDKGVYRVHPLRFLKNRFSLWSLCALSLVVFAFSACSREPLHQSQTYVFGTLVDISIYGEEKSRAIELASNIEQDFQRLHHKLHAWDESSELSRINRAFASGETVTIDEELAKLIEDAQARSVQSHGLFNPAIGGLIKQWGFQGDSFNIVAIDQMAIEKLVSNNPQMSEISIRRQDSTIQVKSNNPAVKLDLGGYAKGYALDRALDYLKSQGVKHALVNIGGNVIALGRHGDRHWRVGIRHPRNTGAIAALDLEDGWAIGTSGDYQRYFELDGVRYCHVLDPRTGYPAQHTLSVTVLVPPGPSSGTLSDVASKPIFITAPEQRNQVATEMGIVHYLVIDDAGHVEISPAMKQRTQWNPNADGLIKTPQ